MNTNSKSTSPSDRELVDFADILWTARAFRKQFRDLVEAEVFPEPFRSAYIRERGEDPDTLELSVVNPLESKA